MTAASKPDLDALIERLNKCHELDGMLLTEAAAALSALREERDAQKKAARAYYDTVVEVHHALGRAGWHPGRTDDRITDIIKAKGEEMAAHRGQARRRAGGVERNSG